MQVLFIDSVHPVLAERLTEKSFICIDGTDWTREKCIEELPKMGGVVIRSRFPMNKEFLQFGTQLKFIARSGAGMENIDLEYANKKNIQCFNAPEGNRNAVGEHALGMLLSLFNNLNKGDREVRQGVWDREANRGLELEGKTVGIIGYGNNGNSFAQKLLGFDVEVLAYDKYKMNYGNQFAKSATLEEIFKKADIISFHIPQNEETMFMADQSFFNAFEKQIYVINLARGKIIRTVALLHGLKTGKIKGACLDVLEYESSSFESTILGNKNSDFKSLLASDKVIFSPHVGGWSKESYFKLSDVLADKILEYF